MSDRLIQLEKDLRSAVTRRCYAEVDGATHAFCVQAAEDWQALPPGDPAAIGIFELLMAVLEWSRLMLCTSRESTAAELRRARLTNRYLTPAGASQSQMRFDM